MTVTFQLFREGCSDPPDFRERAAAYVAALRQDTHRKLLAITESVYRSYGISCQEVTVWYAEDERP